MMKMLIQLDEEKIANDGLYELNDIWQQLDGKFAEQNCVKEVQADNSVIYRGNPFKKDHFSAFGALFRALTNSRWFTENCKVWKLCEEFENTNYSITVDCLA